MCTLLVCAGYCEACITRNFSIKAWKSVSQSYARGEWSCYACQPAPLRLVPQLGSKLAVSFKDEGLCTGEIVGVEGPRLKTGQLLVQFPPAGSEPWVIDPAEGHIFEMASRGATPKKAAKAAKGPSAAGGASGGGEGGGGAQETLGPAVWTEAMADALRTLVLSTGTGNWQHKSEVLGFGHTAKQVNNKWRSLASSDPMLSLVVRVGDGDGDGSGAQAAASGGARSSPLPGGSPAAKPKVPKKVLTSVTVVHQGEQQVVQIAEGGTAEVQGERLEAKLRKVLQIVPGHRFVLLGKSG